MKMEHYYCDICRREIHDDTGIRLGTKCTSKEKIITLIIKTGEQIDTATAKTEDLYTQAHICLYHSENLLNLLLIKIGDWKTQLSWAKQIGLVE